MYVERNLLKSVKEARDYVLKLKDIIFLKYSVTIIFI